MQIITRIGQLQQTHSCHFFLRNEFEVRASYGVMSLHKSLALTLALAATLPSAVFASSDLRGSRASMRRQHQVAERNAFTFLRTVADVREFIRKDRLERIRTSS